MDKQIIRSIIVFVCCLISLSASSQKSFDYFVEYDSICFEAYNYLTDLKLDSAQIILREASERDPHNLAFIHLENYHDCFGKLPRTLQVKLNKRYAQNTLGSTSTPKVLRVNIHTTSMRHKRFQIYTKSKKNKPEILKKRQNKGKLWSSKTLLKKQQTTSGYNLWGRHPQKHT